MKNITKNNSMLHRMIALVMAVVMTLTLVAIDSHFHLFADEAEVAANDVDTIDVTNVLKGYSDGHEATVAYASNKSKVKLSVNKADIADIKLTAKVGDEDITVEGKDIDVKDIKYLTYKENATDDKDKLNKNPATPTDADKTSALSENVALTTDGDKNTCVALYYAYKKDNAVVKYIYMGTAKVLYDDVAPDSITIKSVSEEGVVAENGYYLVNKNARLEITFNATDKDSEIDKIVSIKDGSTDEIELENDKFVSTEGSGVYKIKAYDKAGNSKELDKPIIVKRVVKGPSIKSITPKLVKKNGIDFRLFTFANDPIKETNDCNFTVEVENAVAGEDSDDVVYIPSKLYYKIGNMPDVECTSVVDNGNTTTFTFSVAATSFKRSGDEPKRITIYAKDEYFENESVGADQDGDIVFIGKTKPNVKVSGASKNWVKKCALTVAASSDYAYIDTISYSVNGVSNDIVTGGTAFVLDNKTVTIGGVDGVAGGDAASNGSNIYLPDGEHTITFTAKDYAGGEGSAETTVKIDNTAPVVSIKDSTDKNNFNTATEASQACFKISYSDATSGIEKVTAILSKDGEDMLTFSTDEAEATKNCVLDANGKTKTISIPNLDDKKLASGQYSLTLEATDKAGNSKKDKKDLYVNLSDLSVEEFALNVDEKTFDLKEQKGAVWTPGNKLSIDATVKSFELNKGDDEDVKLVVTYTSLNKASTTTNEYNAYSESDGTVSVKCDLSKEGRYIINLMARIHGTKSFSTIASADVVYDKTAPKLITISCVGAYSTSSKGVAYYARKGSVNIKISAEDNNLFTAENENELSYEIKDSRNNDKLIAKGVISPLAEDGKYEETVTGKDMNIVTDWLYKVNFTITDKAGNKKILENAIAFVVDSEVPSVKVKNVNKYNNNKVTLDWSDSSDNFILYRYQITYNYSKYKFDEQDTTKVVKVESKSVKYSENNWKNYKKTFGELDFGEYKNVKVYVQDRAGNKSCFNVGDFVVDGSSPKVTVDDGNKTRSNKDQWIKFTITDDYGIDPNVIKLKVLYKTFNYKDIDSTINNWTIDDKNIIKTMSEDGKTCYVKYKMTQKNNQATAYKFELRGTDKAGRRIITKDSKLQTEQDKNGYYIITKGDLGNDKDAYGNDKKTKFPIEREFNWYYIDEIKPELINKEFSLLLYDSEGTEIPYDSSGNYGYFNKDLELYVTVGDQFNLSMNLIVKDSQVNRQKDHNRSIWLNPYNLVSDTVKYELGDQLKDDTYNLTIQVADACGNYSIKQKVNFFIDKEAPVINVRDVAKINNSDVNFVADLSDNLKGSTYNVRIVRKDFAGNIVQEEDKKGTWENENSSYAETFSAEGDYTITVTADDKAGNEAKSETRTFRIDKTAPVISISGMNDKQTTGVTATISIDEAFSLNYEEDNALGSSDFNVTITKKTDGTAATNVATFGTSLFSEGNPHTVSYNCSEDGEYTITAVATDLAGNKAAEQTKTFKVDSKAPVLKVNAVDKDSKKVENYDPIGSIDSSTPNYVDMSLSVEEAFFATDNVEISVKKDSKDVSSSYFTNYRNSAEISTGTQRFSEDGVYEVSIKAQDELGNKADDYNLVFTVDNTPPELAATNVLDKFKAKTTKTDDGSILLNADDFADIINQGYEALWNVNDTSDFSVDAKIDGVSLIDFSDLSDGYHQLTIKVTDKVGHVAEDEFDFTYDGTAPRIIITGVEDGETVREPFTMTIGLENPDDEITSIVINGNTIDPANYSANNKYEMQVQDYDTYTIEVTAKDKAGNVASTIDEDTGAVFTFKLSEKLSPVVLVIIIIAAILLIALLIFIILASKRKKKNAAA